MAGRQLLGLVLLVLGILGLAYGGFSYTKDRDKAKIGPLQIEITEREHVNVPMWAGVALAVVGGVLMIGGQPRRA
jgi:hypothetical protein